MSNDRSGETLGLGAGNERKRRRSGGGANDEQATVSKNVRLCQPTVQNIREPTAAEQEPTGIPTRVCETPGATGTGARLRKLPTFFQDCGKSMEQRFTESFEKRCVRVLRELQKSDGQLIRDIYRFSSDEELQNFVRVIRSDGHYRRGLLQLCIDGNHVHVAHDCNYSNGTCRCNWWQKAKTFGIESRRDRAQSRRCASRTRSLSDVQNLLKYYVSKGRLLLVQKIGGLMEEIPNEGYTLPEGRPDESEQLERQVEPQVLGDGDQLRSRREIQVTADEGAELLFHDDEPDPTPPRKSTHKKRYKFRSSEALQVRIVEMCKRNPICPPESIVKHSLWLTDEELRFKNLQDREVKAAIANWTNQLTNWTMKDYQELYTHEDCRPIFSAGYGNFETYYYNVENSVAVLDQLVGFQCDEDSEQIIDFLSTLYNVLERKVPKLNCITILSPPSAGKNYFFDCVKDYYINCGHLCNANKYNSFAFQDAEGRRIILWNEPNYSPEYLEPIKEILGGDSTCVTVKYMPDMALYRTPVIVLTNQPVSFMDHPAFADRVRVFTWKAAPFLKEFERKPNPLAIYYLFKKYNLVE